MITTLNKIKLYKPNAKSWKKLLDKLGKKKADDEELKISAILEHRGLDDAIWCLRAVEGKDKEIRLFAVWCARQVQHLMMDIRSIKAIDVAEKFALSTAGPADRSAARNDAEDAATDAAWLASGYYSLANDKYVLAEANNYGFAEARDAMGKAAEANVRASAAKAAWGAAADAAWDAAEKAARAAARAALMRGSLLQVNKLIEICGAV